jgi:sarcosine oxidase subunit alpha
MTGRVTSCNYSPTLGKAIGMAYVLPEQAKPGNTVRIKSSGGVLVDAQIVDLPFYDPDNSRQAL